MNWLTNPDPAARSLCRYNHGDVLLLAREIKPDWVLMVGDCPTMIDEKLGRRGMGAMVGLLLLGKRVGKVASVRPILDKLRSE